MDGDVTTEAAQEDESQLDPIAAAAMTKPEDISVFAQEEATFQKETHPLNVAEILHLGDSNVIRVERLSNVSPVQVIDVLSGPQMAVIADTVNHICDMSHLLSTDLLRASSLGIEAMQSIAADWQLGERSFDFINQGHNLVPTPALSASVQSAVSSLGKVSSEIIAADRQLRTAFSQTFEKANQMIQDAGLFTISTGDAATLRMLREMTLPYDARKLLETVRSADWGFVEEATRRYQGIELWANENNTAIHSEWGLLLPYAGPAWLDNSLYRPTYVGVPDDDGFLDDGVCIQEIRLAKGSIGQLGKLLEHYFGPLRSEDHCFIMRDRRDGCWHIYYADRSDRDTRNRSITEGEAVGFIQGIDLPLAIVEFCVFDRSDRQRILNLIERIRDQMEVSGFKLTTSVRTTREMSAGIMSKLQELCKLRDEYKRNGIVAIGRIVAYQRIGIDVKTVKKHAPELHEHWEDWEY